MKIKNKLTKLISGFTAAVMCITMLPNLPNSSAANVGDIFRVSSETNKYIGGCNGYEHEVSIDTTGGNGSMTLGQAASFNAEWSVSVPGGNFIARRGKKYGALRKATDYSYIRLDYDADFRQTGTGNEFGHSSLYVSGWFQNRGLDENVPLVKYYIIEDWVDWCPDARGKTVTIDGAPYKIFQMNYSGPTINNGFETYTCYYSVRQTKRSSGHITVSDHFEAWEKEGWDIGNLYDVNMCVEGYQSSGYADVDVHFYLGPMPDPVPQPQPEPEPEPSQEYIRGDLNNDSKVNIFDLVLEKQTIINDGSRDVASPAADVDGDGQIAVNDLVLLSQYIHGKITKFPSAAPSTETASE